MALTLPPKPMLATMRAWVIADQQLHLEERPTPQPGPGDVLVAVKATGLNAADLLQRLGFYPAPAGSPPDIPGLEVAGEVEAVGEGVPPSLLHTRVMAVVGGGGHATHCVVPAEHLLAIPDRLSWAEAGGFPEAFATAHDALVTQAGVRRGDRVVITGAAGGVGQAAIQIARWCGAVPLAVTRDASHHDDLYALGAHQCLTAEDIPSLEPVDVVMELVGAVTLEALQHRLAPRARVVIIGVGGGSHASFNLLGLMSTRATVTGSTLRARPRAEKADVAAAVQRDLLTPLSEGDIHVPLSSIVSFDHLPDAYEAFSARGKFGKIVVTI